MRRSSIPRMIAHAMATLSREGISLDGEIRMCNRTKVIELTSVNEIPDTLRMSPRLALHPQLPRRFPGFDVEIARG